MDPNFLNSSLEGMEKCLQFPDWLPVTEKPVIKSGEIKDFPFLGVCSKCKLVSWFQISSSKRTDAWGHTCNLFASPYVRERRWDTKESIFALRKNLLCLITEANDYLQEKFGTSPHLIKELPQLPPLYWPFQLEPNLHPYIYEPAGAANQESSLEKGTPFLYLCPSCRRIVWHDSTGDVLDHWDSEAHDGTIFSTDVFTTTSVPNVDDRLRSTFEDHNISFRCLIRTNPDLLQHFRQPTRSCYTRQLPLRLPCDQFTDVASEVWVQDSRVDKSHPINWIQKATDMYLHLQVAFGSSPHADKPVPPPTARPGAGQEWPPFPMVEDPDVREILDFRDRMADFLRSKAAMLATEPGRPEWAPDSLLTGQPYKCFSNLASPAQRRLNASMLEHVGDEVVKKRSHSERSPPLDRSQGLMFYIKGLGAPKPSPKYLTPDANIPLTPLYAGWQGLIPLNTLLKPQALALGMVLYNVVSKPIPRSRPVVGSTRPANGTMPEALQWKMSRRSR